MSGSGSNLIVGIDSQTLVWDVRKVGTQQQLDRARWLIELLDGQKAQVIVPAIALSEFLCPIAKEKHATLTATITDRFLVLPFDVICASVAAELFTHGNQGRPKGTPDSRKVLRADCLIVATAARHGARVFYSGDKGCRNLASQIKTWEVRDLPSQPETLFEYTPDPSASPTASPLPSSQ